MTPDLQDFANADTDYIAKHDANNAALRLAINALQTAVASSSVSVGPYLTALFGAQTAFIGSTSYTHSEATTIMTLSAGYAWRPDLGQVVSKGITSPLNFSGKAAATYYIQLDAAGSPSISDTLITPLYSVVWTGSAFGTITRLAPIIWNFGDWTDAQVSTALAASYDSLDARLEAGETLIAGVTAPQTANKIYAGPVSGSPAAPGFRASVVADLPFAGSALGVATLDGSGKVPSSQLPAAVTGAMSYIGTWNATTNSPALASGVGTKGNFYKVATAGTTSLDGIAVWNVGDSVVFDGTTWDKIDGIANEVISVAGKTGVVVLVAADLPNTAVTPGSYGDGTHTGQFTVDAQGRLTAAASVTITGAAPTGAAGGALAGTFPNPTLAAQADNTIIANISGSPAVPAADTLTAILDHILGSTRGMTLYRGASAWAALAAGTAGQVLQTQGTSGDPQWVSQPFDFSGYFSGMPTASASKVVVSIPIARAVTFAANFAGCYLKLRGTTATGSTAFDIQKNGSSIGTATIAASGSSATFTSSGGTAQTFAAGDVFALVAPATPDATADNVGWVFAGTR